MRHIMPKQLIGRSLASLVTAAVVGCSLGGTEPEPGGTESGAIALVILPTGVSISQGGSSSVGATLTASGNFTGAVNLTVTGAPIGVTGVVSIVQTLGLVTYANVTISVGASAILGSYTLVVRGTGTGVADATAAFALTVTEGCPLPGDLCQWATSATASSEYTPTEWSANQATGAPDVAGCEDDGRAWASLSADGVDWLELEYRESVRPTEIRVHENLAVSSIVKVEVKDGAGTYHTVYTAQPGEQTCPRVLTIPVTSISASVKVVRVSLDQRTLNYWNEIDAVRLTGIRQPTP